MRYSNSSDQYCFSSKTMYVPCSNHPTQMILIYTIIAGGDSKLACYSLSLCFLLVVLILLGYGLSLLMRLKWSLFTIYWKFQMYIHTYIHTLYIYIYIGEGNGTPLQYCCLANPMDGGAWWAAVHGVAKSRTRLSDFTVTFHFHALEKEMATHSSVLAWRIPGMVEPGGLPSLGSHRVGHDWSDSAAAATSLGSPVCLFYMNSYSQTLMFYESLAALIKLRFKGPSLKILIV